MNFDTGFLFYGFAIGIGATLFMDAWALFLKRAFAVPTPDFCLVGRWVLHMPHGKFVHASIAKAERRDFECAAGWVTHYVVGVVFALVFVSLAPVGWPVLPTLLPPLLFGVVTVLFPLLVLQPSLGHGIAASKAPSPAHARLRSLMTHTVYGIGLYAAALGVNCILQLNA